MKTLLLSFAFCFGLTSAVFAEDAVKPIGPAMLTVAGAVINSNRGPSGADDSTVFGAFDVSFEMAMSFDFAMLAALPQKILPLAFPSGAETNSDFRGPTLASVLEAAGSSGKTALVTGLDGYQVEIAPDLIADYDPIVAIARDEQPLGIGGLGPAMIVFPSVAESDVQDTLSALQVWGAFLIQVE